MLVYIAVLAVIMGVGYAAVYRCMDNSVALRRNAEDIAATLRAGETWRTDVRNADSVRSETNGSEQILHLPHAGKDVAYRFAEHAIARRIGNGSWSAVLENVNASAFMIEPRSNIQSLRWEVELQPRRKKLSGIQPLFTFIAVPTNNVAQ